MSNIQKWRVMSWDHGMRRYVEEYVTEFSATMPGNEVRREVLRCDRNLSNVVMDNGACETIVVRVESREDRQRYYAAYDAARGYDLDDFGNSFHDYD